MLNFTLSLFMLLVALASVYGLILWCKKATDGDKAASMGLLLLFGTPGTLLSVAGLALGVNGRPFGWAMVAFGLALCLPLLKPVRRAFAAWTPIDPNSAIDYSGLAIILALIVMLLAIALSPEKELTIKPMSMGDMLANLVQSALAFVGLAYVCVGYRQYRTGEESTRRLGIWKPTPREVVIAVLAVIPAFAFAMIGSALTQALQPDVTDRLGKNIDALTQGVQNPAGALILGLATGIGEEVFFRGAMLPRYGVVLTTAAWVLLHTQYEASWLLLGLALMGVMLAEIRKRWGTVPAIITHALYNIIVVLLQQAIS